MRLIRALSALLMLRTAARLHKIAYRLTDIAHGLIVTAEQLREKTRRSF